ncbi:hypothetical protein JW835_14265 [bacterium]|nr:hypothetical protein [bacterium]
MDAIKNSSPNNIDQIRNLIFGEQIQDYERRFQELIKKFENLKKSLQIQKNELDEQLNKMEFNFKQSLSDQHNDLQKELKKQTQFIKQEILTVEEHLSKLTEDKLDKNQMADLLINLAMQLKGESILDQIDRDITPHE